MARTTTPPAAKKTNGVKTDKAPVTADKAAAKKPDAKAVAPVVATVGKKDAPKKNGKDGSV